MSNTDYPQDRVSNLDRTQYCVDTDLRYFSGTGIAVLLFFHDENEPKIPNIFWIPPSRTEGGVEEETSQQLGLKSSNATTSSIRKYLRRYRSTGHFSKGDMNS